jgi:hypothetical protein
MLRTGATMRWDFPYYRQAHDRVMTDNSLPCRVTVCCLPQPSPLQTLYKAIISAILLVMFQMPPAQSLGAVRCVVLKTNLS